MIMSEKSYQHKKPGPVRAAVFAAMMALAGTATFEATSVMAEEKKQERKKYKTKRTPTLSLKVHEKLQEAQVFAEANQTAEALKVLDGFKKKFDKLNSYEKAMVYNFYAFVYYSSENYPKAIQAYKNVLAQPDLPEALQTGTLYSLSQMYFVQENYKDAVNTLEKWFEVSPTPGASAWVLLGQGYYQLQNYTKGIPAIEKAVALNTAKGLKAKENWYLLLRAMYYDKEDYPKTFEIIKELVRHYPKKQYYSQMAAMYSQMNQDFNQYSMIAAMNDDKQLSKSVELVSYSQLLLQNERPYRAAIILSKGMKDKTVEATENNLKLLANAWMLSREDKKAIPVLAKAAKLSKKGNVYISLAQSHLNLENWKGAEKAARAGLKKGGLKRPDQAQINLGMALFNQKKYNEALKAFAKAKKDDRSRKVAIQWEKYTRSERDREKALKASM